MSTREIEVTKLNNGSSLTSSKIDGVTTFYMDGLELSVQSYRAIIELNDIIEDVKKATLKQLINY